MNLKNIRDFARYRLNDSEKPYHWVDAELNLYANEAEKIIARKTRVLNDSTTESCCEIDVEQGTLDYALDPVVIDIVSAKLSTTDLQLTKRDKHYMDKSYPGWRTSTQGEPTVYLLDYQKGYITLYSPPDDDYTLDLTVVRYPLDDMAQDTDEPEIPVEFHHALVDGICYQAYLKWGDRTYDAAKSKVHLDLFSNAIAEAKVQGVIHQAADETYSPHGAFT